MSGNAISNATLLRRIDALEKKVAALAPANRITSTTNRAGGVPPKPTDLTVVLSPGLAHLSWTGSRSSDLLTYLVEVSTSSAFVGVQEFEESSVRFLFADGIEGITYFARVFALNGSRARSDPSNVVTFTIGAGSGSSAASSQVALTKFTKSTGSFATLNTNNETETYGPCAFTTASAASKVKAFTRIDCLQEFSHVSSSDNANILIELLRRVQGGATDTIVASSSHEGIDTTNKPFQILFNTEFETPGTGTFEYRIRLTCRLAGGNSLTFTASRVSIEALVLQ